jgi:hypothetical protein
MNHCGGFLHVDWFTMAEQCAAPDRLQLRSFLTSLPAAGELVVRSLRAALTKGKFKENYALAEQNVRADNLIQRT